MPWATLIRHAMTFCTVQSAAGHEKQSFCIVTQWFRTVEAKIRQTHWAIFPSPLESIHFAPCSLVCLWFMQSHPECITSGILLLPLGGHQRHLAVRAPWMTPSENLSYCAAFLGCNCRTCQSTRLGFLFENMLGRNWLKIWMLYIVCFVFLRCFFNIL